VLERPAKRKAKPQLTLEALRRELVELRQRVEDLEDLRELNQAIERNGNKPLVRWAKAKKELGLALKRPNNCVIGTSQILAMGAQAVSHGVAEDGSPRREPWGKMRCRQKPRQGRQNCGISFRRFATPIFCASNPRLRRLCLVPFGPSAGFDTCRFAGF